MSTKPITLDPSDPFDAALIPIVETNGKKRADLAGRPDTRPEPSPQANTANTWRRQYDSRAASVPGSSSAGVQLRQGPACGVVSCRRPSAFDHEVSKCSGDGLVPEMGHECDCADRGHPIKRVGAVGTVTLPLTTVPQAQSGTVQAQSHTANDRGYAGSCHGSLRRAALACHSVTEDSAVDRATAHYPPADISPDEFEEFVTDLFRSTDQTVDGLEVTLHEKIEGVDGSYNFDATVRYEFSGMSFLVLVEAKRHKDPIKRELVQVLYQKVQSVGAHKGVMISTAPYQSGGVKFAKTHGIALVTVTEGRFTFKTKARFPTPAMSREEAASRFGAPTFVGHHFGVGSQPGSTSVTLMSPAYPEYVVELLLACPPTGKSAAGDVSSP